MKTALISSRFGQTFFGRAGEAPSGYSTIFFAFATFIYYSKSFRAKKDSCVYPSRKRQRIVYGTVLFVLITVFTALTASAQNKYSAYTISPALLKGADVVKRMEEVRFEVISLHEALYTRKYALTILNEDGQDYADIAIGYDKLHKVTNIEGALYDAAGNQLKKVKGKDIADRSAMNDISLYDDNRVKLHDFGWKTYPYTVEYEVEVVYNHTFFFPDWLPQNVENLAVEQSAYSFVSAETYTPHYKAFNYKAAPALVADKGKKGYRWEVKALAATVRPFASPRWNELTPSVFFSPSDFEIEGYKGNASTWAEFGRFMLALTAGRDKLPPAITAKVAELTAGAATPQEKVARLYQYLQQNTRYISIQLGIGGFQPFEAGYVAQKGYGDCKALSNYMHSLLTAAGIPSNLALISAGKSVDDKYLIEDLPSTQFNHMILLVPMTKDTMWLECTSQTDPAGYMGGFTGNRKALMITPDGGKLVPTPRYGMEQNGQHRVIRATLDAEGNLSLLATTRYGAIQQDHLFGLISNAGKDRIKQYLNQQMDLSTYDIKSFNYQTTKGRLPEVAEDLAIDAANYANVSGRRLFVVPNIMSHGGYRMNIDTARTCDYVFEQAYRDVDSVEITVPAGYVLEATQPAVSLKTKFGTYTASTKLDGDRIIYYRKMEQPGGRYPAKDGPAIADFYSAIYKADRGRVVLVKRE